MKNKDLEAVFMKIAYRYRFEQLFFADSGNIKTGIVFCSLKHNFDLLLFSNCFGNTLTHQTESVFLQNGKFYNDPLKHILLLSMLYSSCFQLEPSLTTNIEHTVGYNKQKLFAMANWWEVGHAWRIRQTCSAMKRENRLNRCFHQQIWKTTSCVTNPTNIRGKSECEKREATDRRQNRLNRYVHER